MDTSWLRTVVGVVFMCILHTSHAFAQQHTSSPDTLMQANVWALQFRVAPNFTLTSFQGGIISAMYQLTKRRALRLGVSGSARSDDQDGTETSSEETDRLAQPEQNTLAERDETVDGRLEAYSLGVETQLIRYLPNDTAIKPYWGYGPMMNYSYSESRTSRESENPREVNERNDTSRSATIQRQERTTWAWGAQGIFGVEWLMHPQISLLAEYGLRAAYVVLRTEQTVSTSQEDRLNAERFIRLTQQTNTSRTDGWRISGEAVRFGVSVYF